MSPKFPTVLRDLIALHGLPEGERNQTIRSLDEETKRVALEWLDSHSNVLAASLKIRGVRQVLQGEVAFNLFEYIFENQLFSGWASDPLAPLKEWVDSPSTIRSDHLTRFLHKSTPSDFSNGVSFLLDCRDCGIITWSQLRSLLTDLDKSGKSPLHDEKYLKTILVQLPERLNFEQIHDLLTVQDILGNFPLQNEACLQEVLNLPAEKLSFEQLRQLLQLQGRFGQTPLHKKNCFQEVLNLFPQKISFDQLQELLQAEDRFGKTPLQYEKNLQTVLDLVPEHISFPQLKELLKMQNGSGKTPLHEEKCLQEILNFLPKHLNLGQFYDLLNVSDKSGNTPLHFKETLKVVLSFFPERLTSEHLYELLKIQNESGKTALHNHENLQIVLALFEESLNKREWTELFSIQDVHGNTPLHAFADSDIIRKLLNELDSSILDVRNKLGMSILESILFIPSIEWLEKAKTTVEQEHLTDQEYRSRAEKLKESSLSLWSALSFGEEEGQVPSIFLRIDSQSFDAIQVRQAIEYMLDKIISKEPWMGTPPEGNREALHEFYTPMLLNFEKIVQKLQEKEDPNEIAGVLFDIAKTQLEGRCAAAYQGEIEQSAALLSGEEANLSTESLLERGAKNTLIETIEKTMHTLGSTDVHTYNQLAYAGGLLPAPDPLCDYYSIEQCLEILKKEWVIPHILPDLAEAFKKIPTEQMIDWFKEKTDDLFGEEYLSLKGEAQTREEELLGSTKNSLLEKGLSERQANSAIELFRSSKGASLAIRQESLAKTKKELESALLENISTHLGVDLQGDFLEGELTLLFSEGEDNWQKVFEHIRQALNIPLKKRLFWQNMAVSFIASRVNAQKLFKEPFMQELSAEEQGNVLEEKLRFDEQMKALVKQLSESSKVDLSINLKEHGLPSKAIDNSRKMVFAASFFKEEEEELSIALKGILFAAKEIGVLEEL